jgi:hypothetical protein
MTASIIPMHGPRIRPDTTYEVGAEFVAKAIGRMDEIAEEEFMRGFAHGRRAEHRKARRARRDAFIEGAMCAGITCISLFMLGLVWLL